MAPPAGSRNPATPLRAIAAAEAAQYRGATTSRRGWRTSEALCRG